MKLLFNYNGELIVFTYTRAHIHTHSLVYRARHHRLPLNCTLTWARCLLASTDFAHLTPTRLLSVASSTPVSYTHLDVYKRQV